MINRNRVNEEGGGVNKQEGKRGGVCRLTSTSVSLNVLKERQVGCWVRAIKISQLMDVSRCQSEHNQKQTNKKKEQGEKIKSKMAST